MEQVSIWELPININSRFMKKVLLTIIIACISSCAFSQLERVIVERYYVSDENDATDEFGGGVPVGTVTYRVYADLLPGTVLKKLYGDANRVFEIVSTAPFFNHASDGQSFAKDFIRARYLEGTVALDTWLTLGPTTRLQGGVINYGILKDQDSDGSFIGGANNDGGSAEIASGLLINEDPSIGNPLTLTDGMIAMSNSPTDWFSNGLTDFVTGEDTTMFGSINVRSFYRSNLFELSNSGVTGPVEEENQILIAQLSTTGDLSFILNLEVEFTVDGEIVTRKYVGTSNDLQGDEEYNPFLVYPFECGCNDPSFIEFDPNVVCLEEGSCITPVIYGCLDPEACNFDANANFNIPALCCYPGFCADRDIEKVCPSLKGESFDFEVFPNPTENSLSVNVISGAPTYVDIEIFNNYGVSQMKNRVDDGELNLIQTLSVIDLPSGLYHVSVTTIYGKQTKLFVKL
jgi:hypothetical protein